MPRILNWPRGFTTYGLAVVDQKLHRTPKPTMVPILGYRLADKSRYPAAKLRKLRALRGVGPARRVDPLVRKHAWWDGAKLAIPKMIMQRTEHHD